MKRSTVMKARQGYQRRILLASIPAEAGLFDPQNYQPGERQSYAREWLPAASQAGKAHSEFVQPLPFTLPETVPLETLQRFWAHPVRAFFQMRLQVNFRTEDSEIPEHEPFILEGLSRYQINQQLLNALVEQDDAERLFPPLPGGRGFTVWRFW